MRWEPGFLCRGRAFVDFWGSLAQEDKESRRGLFIAGRGFDPRTLEGPRAIVSTSFPVVECCLVRLTNPQDSPDRPPNLAAATNESTLREMFRGAKLEIKEVAVRDAGGRLVGSTQTRALFADKDWLKGFTDVIVDITALPTSIAFPLLGTLISIYDAFAKEEQPAFNLHCIVCENADLDEHIVAEGGDIADFIEPFRGRGRLASEAEPITIWAPVLGEGQDAALRKIYEMLSPAETKPFLPFPSRNPRRGDDLIAEYHSLLFETWDVDPRAFLYADESDPFDVYRQISSLAADYRRSLEPLGVANTVVSAHTSKLLSLGVLLAAYEHSLAVAHVESTGYSLDDDGVNLDSNELFEVWLTGQAYVAN